MLAASCVLSEEQFLCSICLDVFNNPVTIPCGHNFCKPCISQHWNINPHCSCPMCKKQFKPRPELPVNTFIAEMATGFKQSAGKKKHEEIQVAKPGEISCDICTGSKLKAVKSCLTCFASYCGIHIDPHLEADSLKQHLLIDPVDNLDARVCSKHKKPLELFCRTDQVAVCCHCTVFEHMGHNISSLSDESEAKKAELQQADAVIQQMIQGKRRNIEDMERIKTHSKDDAEREIADGVQIFTALMQTAERNLNELIEVIEDRQKATEREANAIIQELEQDISEHMKESAEVEQLSHTQDHLLLLQSFRCMNSDLNTRSHSKARVYPPTYEGTVVKAVAELENTLSREKKQLLHEARLQRVQRYAVDLTLDPQTANPWLVLSDDNKQVRCGEVKRELPDHENRFSLYVNVISLQSFSSGRFYYEVQVSGKTDWTLGVVKQSVNRKAIIPLSPANGYWSVGLRNGHEYLTLSSPVVALHLDSRPQIIGVFVSYEEGLVSFYDVGAATELYSFTNCSFTETLFPFFSPGLHHGGANSDPLILSPVSIS